MVDLRPGLLFDVDGTLVDTNYLHTLAWSRALRDVGEWAPMNAIHRLVGMGGDQMIPELLGHDCPRASDARKRRYQDLIEEAVAFCHAEELLRYAKQQGLAVVLATSSPEDELDFSIEKLHAQDVIDGYTTADHVKNSKPAPDVFVTAMETASLDPRRSLAIGDSIWDVQAARAAGIGCVAVESGGFSQHELSEEGAIQVYKDVDEVLKQFHTGPLASLIR